jgi:hypothetical protein
MNHSLCIQSSSLSTTYSRLLNIQLHVILIFGSDMVCRDMEMPNDVTSHLNRHILTERSIVQLYVSIHKPHIRLLGPSSNFHSTFPTEPHSDSPSTVLSFAHADLPSRTFTLSEIIWNFLPSHFSTSQTAVNKPSAGWIIWTNGPRKLFFLENQTSEQGSSSSNKMILNKSL